MFQYYEEPEPFGEGDKYNTRYHVIGSPIRSQNLEEDQERPMGHIVLQHRQFTPNFDGHAGFQVSEDYKEHTEQQAHERGEDPYEHSDELPDPTTLFSETPPTVWSASGHSSIRHAMPTLLAHAYNKHGRLQADYSLSAHSAPIVKRGIAAGLATAHPLNPTADTSNRIDFADWKNATSQATVDNEVKAGTFREIPKEDIYRAKQLVRHMVRPQKKHSKAMGGPQFNHPQLPGMEGM